MPNFHFLKFFENPQNTKIYKYLYSKYINIIKDRINFHNFYFIYNFKILLK